MRLQDQNNMSESGKILKASYLRFVPWKRGCAVLLPPEVSMALGGRAVGGRLGCQLRPNWLQEADQDTSPRTF
jgi:hypothetical protein